MIPRGTVFLAENFIFSDSTVGRKLLVLLNNPSANDPLFLVKTTSQKHSKPLSPGCIASYHKVFFLKAKSDYFEKDTWVQLDDYFPTKQNYAKQQFKKIGELTSRSIDEIVKCFLQINKIDLSPKMRNYLEPPIQQGINALAEKFNKKNT